MNACTRNCWIAGALAGLAVAAFLLVISHMSLVAALFLGVVTAALLAALLVWGFCARTTVSPVQPGAMSGTEAPAQPAPAAAAKAPVAEAPAADAPVAANVPAPAEAEPVPEADPEAERQARALRRKARRQRLAAEKAMADASAPAAAATEAPAKPKPTKAEREARAARRAARQAPAALRADGEPELLAAPRDGKADDLKAIKGVGPKFEKLLNAQGVWHYDQIASWVPKDIAAIDARLEGFSGRIERDGWVAQAGTLAAGGTTEFSRRVAEGDVYKGGA